jgi:integrase-like protein
VSIVDLVTLRQFTLDSELMTFIGHDDATFREPPLRHDSCENSPYYPQSNGKMEQWFKTLQEECIRVKTPLCLEDARRIVTDFVAHYNDVRLHSAIGYVTPGDKMAGREPAIFAERDRKLEAARERRRTARQASRTAVGSGPTRSLPESSRGATMIDGLGGG